MLIIDPKIQNINKKEIKFLKWVNSLESCLKLVNYYHKIGRFRFYVIKLVEIELTSCFLFLSQLVL